ncbi:uncharacterized protein [Haliotis asinina]
MPSHLGLTEDPQRNMLIIKWKKKLVSRSRNSLLFIPLVANDSGICYNITINSKSYRHKRLRLRCTDADTMDVTNRRFLLVDEDANPVAVNKPMPGVEAFHEPGKTCDCWSVEDPHQGKLDCWSPGWVQLNPIENRSMEVDVVWNPCNTSSEIVVMIGQKGSHTTSDMATFPTYKSRNCLHSQKFTIKEPGEYEAWVGALGCESPVYVKSAALQMPYQPYTVPENEVFRAITQPDEVSRYPSITLVVVLVGAFAFIGCLSLGVACLIKRMLGYGRQAPVTDPETEPLTGNPTYTIVKGSKEKAVKAIAESLRRALPGSNNDANTNQDRPSMNDIQIVVLLHDIHAQDGHSKLGNYSNRSVTLQLDYTRPEMESPLVVHVPHNMDHPSFTWRNNHSEQSVGLSLSDFLQKMDIRCSLTSPEMTGLQEEVKQLSKYRRDEIKNILLISGSDHRFHRNACHELGELLRMVGKSVIDPYDVDRNVIKEIGPQEWTMKQICKADLTLIVSSDKVCSLVDCYEREEASGTIEGIDICAPLCLKQLSKGNFVGKTALVTLGYGSLSLDRITDMYPELNRDMRYCLVEAKTGAAQEERCQSHALRLFLCRMSSNQTLVDGACASTHCELFLRNIQQMAAAMVETP